MTTAEKIVVLLNIGTFLIISLVLMGGSFFLTFTLGRPPAWLLKRFNRRLFRLPYSRSQKAAAKPYRWFPLSWSLLFGLTVGLTSGLVVMPMILASDHPGLFKANVILLYLSVGYVLIALAVGLHLQVNASRKIKYELFAAGMMMLYMAYLFAAKLSPAFYSKWAGESVGSIRDYIGYEFGGELGSPVVWTAIIGLICCLLVRLGRGRSSEARSPGSVVRFVYKGRVVFNPIFWLSLGCFTSGIGENATASSYAFLGLLFLPLRYLIMQRMLERPILYLRSFAYTEGPLILGRVVIPAVRRYAPVVAVSHELQPPDQILSAMNPEEKVNLKTLNEDAWRQWVSQQLASCLAVILDFSVQTEGVRWELSEALRMVPNERIVILQNQKAAPIPIPGVPVVAYDIDWRTRRRARKELKAHLKRIFRHQPKNNLSTTN